MLNRETIDYAMSFVGVPYRWGGANPMGGLDCSGFVQEILAAAGIDPSGDQTAQGLHDYFANLPGTTMQKGAGALCFYGENTDKITHITWMVNDWQCLGANGGGSKTTNVTEAIKANAFIKMRPYDYRKDLVAVLMPRYSL